MKPSQRAFLITATFVLIGLGSLLAGILLLRLVGHNGYRIFFTVCFGVTLLIACGIRRKFEKIQKRRLQNRIIVLIIIVSTLFVLLTHLPVTTVSVRVHSVPESTEFRLRQPLEGDRGAYSSVFKTRDARDTNLDFWLTKPLDRKGPPLRIYFGHYPGRTYYGRHFFPYDVKRLTYGTDLLVFPIPLTVYEGKSLLAVAQTPRRENLRPIDDQTVRVWGALDVTGDRRRLQHDADIWRVFWGKLAWVVSIVLVSSVALWLPDLWVRTKPLQTVVENFFAK